MERAWCNTPDPAVWIRPGGTGQGQPAPTYGNGGVAQTVAHSRARRGDDIHDMSLTLTPGVPEGDTGAVSYTAGAVGARIHECGAGNRAASPGGDARR